MRIALYVRVSTNKQDTELQKRELLTYAKARGWEEEDLVIYEDVGQSGTSTERPELKKMLAAAFKRQIDIVMCWKMDRLFRSLKDLVMTLQNFQAYNVQFISLHDNVDLGTPQGKLMMQVIGAFAEFEANIIRERIMAGLAVARAKGKTLGRRIRRDDEKIRLYRGMGYSVRGIARELNVSSSSVQRGLKKLQTNSSASQGKP